jgi:putative ABC transport system permease protein
MWTRLVTLCSRLRFAFSRQRLDEETQLELESHLELLVDRYVRSGKTPQAAHMAARRQLGSTVLVREEIHQMNSIGRLEQLTADLRFAFRMLRRNVGFALAAIGTLALGIGATTTIFSVVNDVMIRPLPYPQPDALVAIWHSAQFQGVRSSNIPLSSTMYLTYREHNQTFEQFGLWHTEAANVTDLGEPEEVRTLVVTYGTLPALGVEPALGRWFSPTDDTQGTTETVILTHGYWQRRFGADGAAIGRTITIDSRPREIIGVMPQGFRFLNAVPEVILPQRFAGDQLQPNDVHMYMGIARLKPGVSLLQAGADVRRMLPIWITQYGTSGPVLRAARFEPSLRPLKEDVVGDVGSVLWVLMGIIGIVLLIACANVANLLLVRAEGRRQELTIRAALGAGWGRIAQQLLVESVTLGVSGGAIGLALAYGGLRLLAAMAPANLPRLAEISIDPVVLAFTLAVSLLSGLVFGLIPVLKYVGPTRSRALRGALHGDSRTLSQGQARHRLQNALVVAQVGLAVVLLVAAGLMIRTFDALRKVRPGFEQPETVQMVRLSIPDAQVPEPERVVRMQQDIAERIAAIPGVTSVAFATAMPIEVEFENNLVVTAENKSYDQGIPPLRRSKSVSPGMFRTLGTPMLAGRDFTWTDIYDNRQVAVVSENMAREMWAAPSDALGKRIRVGGIGAWNEIIGVVGDVYDSGVDQKAPTIVYWRAGVQRGPGIPGSFVPRAMTFAIRTGRAGTDAVVMRIGNAVWAVNPNLPLARIQTLAEVYSQSMSRTSFTLVMLALAGSMALALGIVGIYAVLSYVVSQRRREVGIRLALGAQPSELRRRFVRHGLVLAGVGVVIGLLVATALTRLLSSLLFGVSPLDPVTYTAVPIILAMTATLASYVSVHRATAVDSLEVLKAE